MTPRELNADAAAAVLSALRSARDHGSAEAALSANGIDLPRRGQLEGVSDEFEALIACSVTDSPFREALALGYLAGASASARRSRRTGEATWFLIDRDLVVRGAHGESMRRLPWLEADLFVDRQIPDIHEVPLAVRSLSVDHYSAALAGVRSRFAFTSYGHTFSIDAVPVHHDGNSDTVEAVLAVATPVRSQTSAATAYELTAERLAQFAGRADRRAEVHRLAGRTAPQAAERHAGDRARQAAELAALNARRLRSRETTDGFVDGPALSPRETEVLQLASQGLTSPEIAERLVVSAATIKTHLGNVYAKLGASDKAAAVAVALRHGLID